MVGTTSYKLQATSYKLQATSYMHGRVLVSMRREGGGRVEGGREGGKEQKTTGWYVLEMCVISVIWREGGREVRL